MVAIKYLIKLWKCGSAELLSTLTWESENVGNLIKEVSKSLPTDIRATIEEINERENEKSC